MRLAATTDHALLLRWRSHGDPAAFAQLVDRHAAMVHTASMRVVHNRALAQEIAQDSFVQLTQLEQFEGDSLGGWLHQVATNRARDIAKAESRRHTRESAYAQSNESLTIPSESKAILAEIDAALDALPGDLRELIVLHYLEGVTHKDIARRTGVSRPTITRKLQRALELLREQLGARGVTATATAILTALESARASFAPAALVATLRKLALSNPPAADPAATSAALFSPSMVALAGTVALLLFLAAVLIPQLVKANGKDESRISVIAQPAIPDPIAPPPAAVEIVLAENQAPVPAEPAAVATTATGLTESVALRVVDASANPVADAEVYLVRTQPLVAPIFAQAGSEDVSKTVYGPLRSDAQGYVDIPPLEQSAGPEYIAYQAFARVPGEFIGAWGLTLDSGRVRREGWDQLVLAPSAPMVGKVTVPRGFDVTKVTVRLLSMYIRDGKNQFGSAFNNASKFEESTIPVLAAQHPDAQGRVQFNDMPVNGNVYFAATAPGLAEAQFFTFERVEEFHIDMPIESTLSGTLRYIPSNAPAVNVPVFARPQGGGDSKIGVTTDFVARTDGAGRFRFTGLPTTSYHLRVFPQGNPHEWVAPVLMNIPVGTAENAGPIDMSLERGGWVEGVVREKTTGVPIPDVWLCVLNPASENFLNEAVNLATTDAEGRYRALLPTGTSTLYYMKIPSGFGYPKDQGKQDITIVRDQREPVKLDFELTAAEPFKDPGRATATGRVVDAEGKPLAGVPVHDEHKYTIGERSEESSRLLGRTGDDGTFSFKIDALGSHTIVVGGEVYNPSAGNTLEFSRTESEKFTATKEQTYTLGDFTVERYTLSVGGSVVDENDNPLEGIYVALRAEGTNYPGMMLMTGQEGRFTFNFVPQGVFQLTVWENGDNYETVNLDVESSFDYQITMKSKDAGPIPR